MIQKILKFIKERKIISGIIILALLGIGWLLYGKLTSTAGKTSYVTAAVKKGTIVASITGTGQVSASNQIDIKPKVSGDVVYIGVANGQTVGAGTLILQIDSTDAEKTVRDAKVNLDNAKLALEKLKNTLYDANGNLISKSDLEKTYEDGFSGTANAFLDLPAIMTGLQDILFGTTLSSGGQANYSYYGDSVKNYDARASQYSADASNAYQKARQAYDQNFTDYKSASRLSDSAAIENLINETYDTSKLIAEAVKSANNLIQLYQDILTGRALKIQTLSNTHLASLNSYTSQTNSHLLDLSGAKTSISNKKTAILNDPIDIASSEASVRQKENALADAQGNLAYYSVRAPFDGTVAQLNVKKFDAISSGTIITTLITRQKIAGISLNEVDAAKIKAGQKATLTFDAVDGLSIAGEVAEVNTIGTVTQGVVTYAVKISFDTQDERIKSGMSVSAAIITDVKQDVLIAPNSAVKSLPAQAGQGNARYVEMLDAGIPRQQTVEAGLSNDTDTEIISGLKEGDQIITRTVNSATTQTAQQAPSLFGGGGGGGGVRIPRGN